MYVPGESSFTARAKKTPISNLIDLKFSKSSGIIVYRTIAVGHSVTISIFL
jgi:hypothetical protein